MSSLFRVRLDIDPALWELKKSLLKLKTRKYQMLYNHQLHQPEVYLNVSKEKRKVKHPRLLVQISRPLAIMCLRSTFTLISVIKSSKITVIRNFFISKIIHTKIVHTENFHTKLSVWKFFKWNIFPTTNNFGMYVYSCELPVNRDRYRTAFEAVTYTWSPVGREHFRFLLDRYQRSIVKLRVRV